MVMMLTKSRRVYIALIAACPFVLCASMHAQSGCVNSPENPTALLALLGIAGAMVARLRRRG